MPLASLPVQSGAELKRYHIYSYWLTLYFSEIYKWSELIENASTLYIHSFNMVITRCSDIAALARAAVSGDESALDMFNWKQKGKTNLKLSGMLGHNEAMTFYIGTQNGKS